MRFSAPGFPAEAVRDRARRGLAAAFPQLDGYGHTLFGAGAARLPVAADSVDALRLVPPVLMPDRLAKLIDLGREPTPDDVRLESWIGGLRSPLPVYVSAFGSTRAASGADLGLAVTRQAGQLGVPIVVGESVVPVHGFRQAAASLSERLREYTAAAPPEFGGVVVQQSTQDADAEVWNLVHSDPAAQPLLDSGRLAFELKVGQGAKPGLGGMTVVDREEAARLADRYSMVDLPGSDLVLRCSSAGTFTEEILRQQIRFMRNNYPRVRVWVKFHPGRDVGRAAEVAWAAGADAVTVDGPGAGTGWAPSAFLDQVGLPLGECLRRIDPGDACLLVSGGVWEGVRAAKCLALGARAVGLGRAALLAADEVPHRGLAGLLDCIAFELRLLISAMGRYEATALGPADVWEPGRPTS